MNHGKYERPVKNKINKRYTLLLISLTILFTVVIGGTLAYLLDSSDKVENTFTPAKVTVNIHEVKQQNIKYNIYVTNATLASKDAVPVYVRAKLVVYWTDMINNKEQVIPKPDNAEIVIPAPVNGWFLVDDTYYYPLVVKPGDSTLAMVLQANPITVTVPAGTSIKCYVDVRAEAIQAEPSDAVEAAWQDVSVGADGNLAQG